MAARIDCIESLDDLRNYVHQTLCEKENLVPDQFQVRELELKKCGRSCGIQFSIYGPRQIRLSALWASDKNVLYFYDTLGVRFLKTQLRNRIESLAARAA
jgi:hypothetical protein